MHLEALSRTQAACWAAITLLAAALPAAGADLLVAMNGSGRVERYDPATGRHLGTLIAGLRRPNHLRWAPDGVLLISRGAVRGRGAVSRFDGRTGRALGDLVNDPPGRPGYLARAAGMAGFRGDLYVAGSDDSTVKRYDSRTGAYKDTVYRGNPNGWITQIAIRQGALYVTEFSENRITRIPLIGGGPSSPAAELAGMAPWGVAFEPAGGIVWSGASGIGRAGGPALIPAAQTPTTLHITFLSSGLLAASCAGKQAVQLWDLSASPPRLVRSITGPSVADPMGAVEARYPMPEIARAQIAGALPPSAPASPETRFRLEADTRSPAIESIGWDTEGGPRASVNLLRSPIQPTLLGPDGAAAVVPAPAFSMPDADTAAWRWRLAPGAALDWSAGRVGGAIHLAFRAAGPVRGSVARIALAIPLDPHTVATCVIGGEWTAAGRLRLPFILNAPDLGAMRVSSPGRSGITARWEGSRVERTATLTFDLPAPSPGHPTVLSLTPVTLPMPAGASQAARWRLGRRGWFNLLQLSSERPGEGGHRPTPAGIWANNLISDPVCSTLYFLGDHVRLQPELAPGVSAAPILRRAVDFWIHRPVDAAMRLPYTVTDTGQSLMADTNPAALIGAWCYVAASGDLPWLRRRIARLEAISSCTEKRDTDGDGLVESVPTGNRGAHVFGDTAWDTIASGHKNAYVNALAHRAWIGMADLERRLGRAERAAHYDALAARLRAAFLPALLDPASGWLAWWRSADGMLHVPRSDVPLSMAVNCGVITPARARPLLERYLAALDASSFRRFDLGVPTAVQPIHRDDQFQGWGGASEDGSDTFGKYLNGGCCVSNTAYLLAALYAAGLTERADRILDAMLRRQSEGVFPNGGGFQNGVIDRFPDGAEFFDWQGATCGYEGHLVYSWAFLQAVLIRDPALRARLLPALSRAGD